MKVLLTGGAGYIASHTAIELINSGHSIVIVDNLSNSSTESVKRVSKIVNQEIPFYEADVRDRQRLAEIFEQEKPEAVVHFAGLKAVGESVEKPLEYYDNNINSTLTLLRTMLDFGVNKLVFSSSATVYGDPGTPVYTEELPTGHNITNPYGQTKYMNEQIIRDTCVAHSQLEATFLRYFNPIGAHESGMIGDDPAGIPNNIMPFITQVATGKREKLSIFGNDYPTPDGTCRRDYPHVMDLASGHVAALENLKPGVSVYNLGSGKPVSVLELVNAFIESTGKAINYEFAPRRAGDLPEYYADASKAERELGWTAKYSIEQACQDAWRWQSQNPDGYR